MQKVLFNPCNFAAKIPKIVSPFTKFPRKTDNFWNFSRIVNLQGIIELLVKYLKPICFC